MPSTEHNCIATHRTDPERPRRAADGLQLCRGCVEGMRRQIEELPALYRDVVESLPARRRAGGVYVSGSREPGLPVDLDAGELKSQIEYDMYVRAVHVASERGMLLPADGRVSTVCAWLLRHVDWMAAQPEAAEIRDQLIELTGHSFRVIDPDRPPIVFGRCVEVVDEELCEGTLRTSLRDRDDPRPSRLWCDTCTLDKPPSEWFRFDKRYKARLAAIEQAEKQAENERIAS